MPAATPVPAAQLTGVEVVERVLYGDCWTCGAPRTIKGGSMLVGATVFGPIKAPTISHPCGRDESHQSHGPAERG